MDALAVNTLKVQMRLSIYTEHSFISHPTFRQTVLIHFVPELLM